MINIANKAKNKDFYQKALYDNLVPLLAQEDARFLSEHLSNKLTQEQLHNLLATPIVVINGENSERVDNDFIKRQLMRKGNFDIIAKLNEAKIIICNCNDISVIGLDVIYLFGNKIRLISPSEQAKIKNNVFLSKNNKIINSINIAYNHSIDDTIKNVMHNAFDKVTNTRMLNISPTTFIECDIKFQPFKVKRSFIKSKSGQTYTVYNPTTLENVNHYSVFQNGDTEK